MHRLLNTLSQQKTIFITATNTDVGKTHIGLYLIEQLSKMNKKVGVYKPIETGVKDYPQDAKKLLDKTILFNSDFDFLLDDVTPYQFSLPASPYVAKNNTIIDKRVLYNNFKKLQSRCDILIIEGAGGLMVPIDKNFFMIDLIKLFNAFALLVVPSKLGSINDTLLSSKALKDNDINYQIMVNLYKDKESFYTITYPFYKDSNLDITIK
jgi:dethiobiotin synthetase